MLTKINIAIASLIVVIAIFLTTLHTGVIQRLQSGFVSVISPFLRTGTAVQKGIGVMSKGLKTLPQLDEENRRLATENKELRALNQTLRDVEAENNRLRQALEYRERSVFRLVAAQIISRDASTWWSTVKINRGFEDGVEEGRVVMTDAGVVGKVINVSKNEAIVLLITDETCKIGAYIEGSKEKGIVSGFRVQENANGDLQMIYLSKTADAAEGQKVFTQGVDRGVFPPGLPIGTVESFRARELDGQAILKPLVDFSTLSDVFVIVGMK